MIDPEMLMAEVRRSLRATHPEECSTMISALEELARFKCTAVITMPPGITDADREQAVQMISYVSEKPTAAIALPSGWTFDWVTPRVPMLLMKALRDAQRALHSDCPRECLVACKDARAALERFGWWPSDERDPR